MSRSYSKAQKYHKDRDNFIKKAIGIGAMVIKPQFSEGKSGKSIFWKLEVLKYLTDFGFIENAVRINVKLEAIK